MIWCLRQDEDEDGDDDKEEEEDEDEDEYDDKKAHAHTPSRAHMTCSLQTFRVSDVCLMSDVCLNPTHPPTPPPAHDSLSW